MGRWRIGLSRILLTLASVASLLHPTNKMSALAHQAHGEVINLGNHEIQPGDSDALVFKIADTAAQDMLQGDSQVWASSVSLSQRLNAKDHKALLLAEQQNMQRQREKQPSAPVPWSQRSTDDVLKFADAARKSANPLRVHGEKVEKVARVSEIAEKKHRQLEEVDAIKIERHLLDKRTEIEGDWMQQEHKDVGEDADKTKAAFSDVEGTEIDADKVAMKLNKEVHHKKAVVHLAVHEKVVKSNVQHLTKQHVLKEQASEHARKAHVKATEKTSKVNWALNEAKQRPPNSSIRKADRDKVSVLASSGRFRKAAIRWAEQRNEDLDHDAEAAEAKVVASTKKVQKAVKESVSKVKPRKLATKPSVQPPSKEQIHKQTMKAADKARRVILKARKRIEMHEFMNKKVQQMDQRHRAIMSKADQARDDLLHSRAHMAAGILEKEEKARAASEKRSAAAHTILEQQSTALSHDLLKKVKEAERKKRQHQEQSVKSAKLARKMKIKHAQAQMEKGQKAKKLLAAEAKEERKEGIESLHKHIENQAHREATARTDMVEEMGGVQNAVKEAVQAATQKVQDAKKDKDRATNERHQERKQKMLWANREARQFESTSLKQAAQNAKYLEKYHSDLRSEALKHYEKKTNELDALETKTETAITRQDRTLDRLIANQVAAVQPRSVEAQQTLGEVMHQQHHELQNLKSKIIEASDTLQHANSKLMESRGSAEPQLNIPKKQAEHDLDDLLGVHKAPSMSTKVDAFMDEISKPIMTHYT